MLVTQPSRFHTARQGADCADGEQALVEYIRRTWHLLTHTAATALLAPDPKVAGGGQADRRIVYAPPGEQFERIRGLLDSALPTAELARVEIRRLPENPETIDEHGLIFVPHRYVVPGGRFPELYGHDAPWIVQGLLRDGELALAQGTVDNLLYLCATLGFVPNANRSYYATRSQPPLLSMAVLDLFRATGDQAWLARAGAALARYHAFWQRPGYLTATGLARYWGGGIATPAPEVLHSERDAAGVGHYDHALAFLRQARAAPGFDPNRYYDRSGDRLTAAFYIGDRAMRESGFDVSQRFGPFGVGITDWNPVCLNTLLYRLEADLAAIEQLLDRPREASRWMDRARWRARRIEELLWDDRLGLYVDYNFARKRRSSYPFITTFYPLWAGIASPERAERVVANLPIFERAGGLQTSDSETGAQWDAPIGWAPYQVMATHGLRRYGYHREADRIAAKFLVLLADDFAAHGTLVEKYDVCARSSRLALDAAVGGYTSNEVGFGWTNAAYLVLRADLSRAVGSPGIDESLGSATLALAAG